MMILADASEILPNMLMQLFRTGDSRQTFCSVGLDRGDFLKHPTGGFGAKTLLMAVLTSAKTTPPA